MLGLQGDSVGLSVSNWDGRMGFFGGGLSVCFIQMEDRGESTDLGRKIVCIMLKGIAIETFRYKCNQSLEICRNLDCDANLIVLCTEERVETMETNVIVRY